MSAPLARQFRAAKEAILKRTDFLLFSSSSVALTLAQLVAGIAVLRWVDPAQIGIWHTVLLMQVWCDAVKLGAVNGMNRELPFRIGRGDVVGGQRVVAATLAYVIASGVLGGLVFLGGWVWLFDRGPGWQIAVLAAGIMWMASNYSGFLQGTFRANRDFRRLAWRQWVEVGLVLATLPMVLVWGFYGLCIRAAVVSLIVAGMLHAVRPVRVSPSVNWRELRAVMAVGLPLFFAAYIFNTANGFDRLILLGRGGVEMVGFYAVAVAAKTAMTTLPNSILLYTYPRLSFSFGKTRDSEQLWLPTVKVTVASVGAAILLAGFGILVGPIVVEHWLPSYIPGLPALQLALVGGIFLAVRPATAILPTVKAWRLYYIYIGSFALANGVFPWVLSARMNLLTGVALGSAVASAVTAAVILVCAWKATHPPSKAM